MSTGAPCALFGFCLLAAVYPWTGTASTWREDFASGRLDPARWQQTLDGDFRTRSTDVVASNVGAGYRLRLVADTRGTRDDIVKHFGIGSRCAVSLRPDGLLHVIIDWGPPPNGSYLAASVILSPNAVASDPTATRDWFSVGYVGVPPGHNARLLVTASAGGVVRTLYADGWPDRNRQGRSIERAEIDIAWRGTSLQIRENGRLVHTAAAAEILFSSAHVYLQLSSHSNYPARAVHFENLRVRHGDDSSPVTGFPSAPNCDVAGAK